MGSPPNKCQLTTFGVIGVVTTLVGAIFIGVWPNLFEYVLYKQLALSPSSYSYGMWKEIPIPMHFDFYFFNWTNPEDLTHRNETIRRPNLVQMGPYVFTEKREKIILNWNKRNNTVTFLQKRTWHFDPDLSNGSLDDLVTTLNVPAVAAVFAIRNDPPLKVLLDIAMHTLNIRLSVTQKVRELLFEGYPNILMDLAAILPEGTLPVTIPFDKFGWFYTRNLSATYEGVFTMYTGEGDMDKFGQINLWNYENPTALYKSHCGILNGSAGEFFPPKPKKDGVISVFSSDICRSLTLPYKEEINVRGLDGYRYWGDEHIFDNQTTRPENECFCTSDECAPHGAMDVSTCKWNTPAYVSFPHFFHGDPSYREAVSGMNPNEELHQMFVDIEQSTGIPLQVEASLQINMLLQPYPEYRLFRDVPKIYFPTFWFKERARLDDKLGEQVRLIVGLPRAGYILFGTVVCIGIAIVVIVGIYYFRRSRQINKDLNLVD